MAAPTAGARRPCSTIPTLNRCLIIKHRLRRDEVDRVPRAPLRRDQDHPADRRVRPARRRPLHLSSTRPASTACWSRRSASAPSHPDRRILSLIDELPEPGSLPAARAVAPQRRHAPDACYFNVSARPIWRGWRTSSADEITPLVDLSMGPDTDLAADNPVARLTAKILSNSAGEDMSALGQTLHAAARGVRGGRLLLEGLPLLQMGAADDHRRHRLGRRQRPPGPSQGPGRYRTARRHRPGPEQVRRRILADLRGHRRHAAGL